MNGNLNILENIFEYVLTETFLLRNLKYKTKLYSYFQLSGQNTLCKTEFSYFINCI